MGVKDEMKKNNRRRGRKGGEEGAKRMSDDSPGFFCGGKVGKRGKVKSGPSLLWFFVWWYVQLSQFELELVEVQLSKMNEWNVEL